MIIGRRDVGSGSFSRIERSLSAQRRYALAAVTKLSASSRMPNVSPTATSSSRLTAASPPAASASAVRIQARNVRSLASVNR
jgi:hypothetical protein